MSISIQSAKAKGRRVQQYVRDKILEIFPRLKVDDVQSTSMGVTGEDVKLSTSARRLFRYKVECKAAKKMSIYAMYEQATRHKGNHQPLLVVKADRKNPLAIVEADHFFELIQENNEYRKLLRSQKRSK